jgi:hypothetical protein
MNTTALAPLGRSLTIIAATAAIATIFTGCAGDAALAPDHAPATRASRTTLPGTDTDGVFATLQRVTARYHRLEVALDDGFVLLHPCEARGDEGPVGTVYVNFARLLDGVVNPESPDALIYEPASNGTLHLVGVELAVPNTGQNPPTFLGATFQNEPEFGVYALHAWVWRTNPEGLFAETNPRVSCGEA